MKIARTVADLPKFKGSVGFVPTMGALHEGHLSLIRAAKRECDNVVVSLFVNPLQFGPAEDLSRYPRSEAKDIDLARGAGGDVMFIPTVELVAAQSVSIRVTGVSDLFDGQSRPGHFDGVATIVCKLFHLIGPDLAYFGLKDRQQCAVVRRLVEDLNMPIGLRFEPTVREHDGLALSSRNVYLSPGERSIAAKLYECLSECKKHLMDLGAATAPQIENVVDGYRRRLSEYGFEVEYFSVVDESNFRPITQLQSCAVLIAAARLGATRLIDNVSFFAD